MFVSTAEAYMERSQLGKGLSDRVAITTRTDSYRISLAVGPFKHYDQGQRDSEYMAAEDST
jgi:hypothetical protein